MRRGGFTLVELLLGGAILATISFGALIGMMRISDFVDKRGELMAADGFCWDLAWKLFNDDWSNAESIARRLMSMTAEDVAELEAKEPPETWDYPVRPAGGARYLEVKGVVEPARTGLNATDYEFLSHLQFPSGPGADDEGRPVCYITLSNRWDAASGVYGEDGVYISVNLEWGPPNDRRILMPRPGMDGSRVRHVFNHPVCVYRNYLLRRPVCLPNAAAGAGEGGTE